jgi:AAA domain-containing protein
MTMPDPLRKVVDLGEEAGITYRAQGLFARLQSRHDNGDRVPGIAEIRAELYGISGPVPARVVKGKSGQDDYLRLYLGGRYALVLNPTRHGGGYLIGDIYPLGLRDHDDIVRSCFALAARSWELYDDPRDLPQYLDARWPAVKAAWQARPLPDGTKAGQRLPRQHEDYLDALELLIEKAREVELNGTSPERTCRYQRITPAAVQRRTAQSVYKFQLMGGSRLTSGTRVHIDEHPGLRGEVTDIRESLVTVTFDRPLDFNHIPPVGAFVASPNMTSLDKQAEAVEMLREQRTRNPRLLDALVSHDFQPFAPARATPREGLDPSQQAAFSKALAVPDLALIQGPPGTGKTHTIKQIVWECTAGGKAGNAGSSSVLVSAYTNQAVDNVLKGLPADLTVVRVGAGVTAQCAHLTLEAQATELQRRILDRTEPVLGRYAHADPETGVAAQRLAELTDERTGLDHAEGDVRWAEDRLAGRDAELAAPFRTRIAALGTELAARRSDADERDRIAAKAADLEAREAKRAAVPVLGWLFRHRARRRAAEAAIALDAAHEAAGEVARTRHALESAQGALEGCRARDPALAELRAQVRAAATTRDRHSERTARSALRLASCIAGADALPAISPDYTALAQFHAAAAEVVGLAQRRLLLLRKWRATLERRAEQLFPELIRYADVVGATCIGAASSKYLGDMTFDLAIIDEAGQIAAPNLLVPLVRAGRAVLVGDHVQLPPYAEQALADWARAEAPAVIDLVKKSAFETLFPHVPAGSRETLNVQRRMPAAIGDFISAQFYGGRLDTDTNRPDRDELFGSPLAFVDTSELPDRERRERRPRQGEPWPATSHVNDAEARLITDLVAWYDARKSDWVVIVPFSAQEGRVTQLLAGQLGDEERVASRVASVDSFQGGEHDTVIFGFTRSNAKGAVGFFSDVRRSNVAFSRSRQRLIMVGDLSTLLKASDTGFRSMMFALHDHVRRRGDLRGYREVAAVLATEAGQ